MNALFACGDAAGRQGLHRSRGDAATKGEGVRILSAAPSLGKVTGSSEFRCALTAKYGAINNYAANSYDSAA